MLLLLKTNDCLRHLDSALGVPVNTATIVAETTSGIILAEELASSTDYQTKMQAIRDFVGVAMRIVVLRSIDYWIRLKAYLSWLWTMSRLTASV